MAIQDRVAVIGAAARCAGLKLLCMHLPLVRSVRTLHGRGVAALRRARWNDYPDGLICVPKYEPFQPDTALAALRVPLPRWWAPTWPRSCRARQPRRCGLVHTWHRNHSEVITSPDGPIGSPASGRPGCGWPRAGSGSLRSRFLSFPCKTNVDLHRNRPHEGRPTPPPIFLDHQGILLKFL